MVGLRGASFELRDAWSGAVSTTSGAISSVVAPHAVELFRVSSQSTG